MISWYLTAVACLWVFPERVLGLSFIFFYLFVWLPWAVIPLAWHLAALFIYMAVTPKKWEPFRTSRLWDWLRANLYPVSHHANDVPAPQFGEDGFPRRRIFAISPHGIFGEGVHLCFTLDKRFIDVTPVGSSFMTWMPITKDICGLAGMIPANREDIVKELAVKKKSIFLVPEGIRGILCEGEPPALQPKRLGFIECAIEAGADIVPVYIHGTNNLYRRWPDSSVTRSDSWVRRFQHWMLSTRLRYCFLFVWGQWAGFFPHTGRPLSVFYGAPISETAQPVPRNSPNFDWHVARAAEKYQKACSIMVAVATKDKKSVHYL